MAGVIPGGAPKAGFMVAGSLITMGTLAGFAILTQVGRAPGLAVLVTGSVIYSLGICPAAILATDLIVGSAPVERAGTASAISEASSELGGALGIAILGSIGTAAYRGAMADAAPVGGPPGAMDAARSTLGAAMALAAARWKVRRVDLEENRRV